MNKMDRYKHDVISHQVMEAAIEDIRILLSGCEENIKSVSLFGSALKRPIEEINDIDFLIDYRGSYEEIKSKIKNTNIGRNVIVQHMKDGYIIGGSLLKWRKENPLRFHLLFYEKGKTKMSPKAIEAEKYALDITKEVFKIKEPQNNKLIIGLHHLEHSFQIKPSASLIK